jgi:molybdate transport system substrate-binding protein
MRSAWVLAAGLLVLSGSPACARAAEPSAKASIAVAANFAATANELARRFAAETGHEAVLSFGSTGTLYAQIANGAPFEVLLAADALRPLRAEAEGLAVPGTRFTYAIGTLVLWSRDPDLVDAEAAVLRRGDFARLAIANPKTAPYGVAAMQTLNALGLGAALRERLVMGTNIVQTFQFVATGNAALGFVALSQVAAERGGSRWVVPSHLHDPILQDAVLLARGADNEAARAFLAFLRSPEARRIIEADGYRLEAQGERDR